MGNPHADGNAVGPHGLIYLVDTPPSVLFLFGQEWTYYPYYPMKSCPQQFCGHDVSAFSV